MDLNWRKVANTTGDHGHFREGHTLTYIRHLDSLLLYGGVSNPRLNAVYLYSISKQQRNAENNIWTLQATEGRKPNHRSHHTALYDEHLQLYMVYGGEAEKGRSLDDFYVLVLRNWTWKKLFLMQFPPARHLHTMTDMRNQERSRVIFGGLSMPSGQLLNDVWIFKGLSNLQSSTQVHEMQGGSCDIQYTKGDVPPGRKGHQSQVHGKCLYVFGGEAKDKNTHFTIYCLSLETFSWRRIQPKKTLPQRIYFSTASYGGDVIIYGGLEVESGKVCGDLLRFNVVATKLEQVRPKDGPLGRYGHSMAITSTSQIDILKAYMVGGMEQTFRPFDLYELTDGSEEHQPPKPNFSRVSNVKDYNQQIENMEIKIIKEKQEKLRLERQLKQRHQSSIELPRPSRNAVPVQQLMTMIKSQQFLSQQILKKNSLLESMLRKFQEYVYVLNQNYLSYGEEEESVERTKQSHIGVCTRLKQTYQLIERYYKKNLALISNSRSEVISYNNEFQGLMETEVDEQS